MILKFFRKVNEVTNECNFLHWHAISFHLSHQPHLYVLHHYLLTVIVPWDQKIVHKCGVMLRDVVDGSNESLYHPNEENYTHFPPRSPSERISEFDGVLHHREKFVSSQILNCL